MSGYINADWNSGKTSAELGREYLNAKEDSIRRDAVKVEVVPDEVWDKWVEEARQRQLAREKAEQDKLARKAMAEEREKEIQEQIKKFESRIARDVNRDARHYRFYNKFLNSFHEPDNEGEFSDEIWKTTYERMACFLTKIDVAFDCRENSTSGIHRRLPGRYRSNERNIAYFDELVKRKKNFKKLSYDEVLKTALIEELKHNSKFLPVSKKITEGAHEDLMQALPAIIHLVDDNNPKDLAAWKALMRSGLDCKKHPTPPNMNWRLEEAFDQNIETLEEAKMLKNMISDPEFLGDYASLCTRIELMKAIKDSDSIRLIFEDATLME